MVLCSWWLCHNKLPAIFSFLLSCVQNGFGSLCSLIPYASKKREGDFPSFLLLIWAGKQSVLMLFFFLQISVAFPCGQAGASTYFPGCVVPAPACVVCRSCWKKYRVQGSCWGRGNNSVSQAHGNHQKLSAPFLTEDGHTWALKYFVWHLKSTEKRTCCSMGPNLCPAVKTAAAMQLGAHVCSLWSIH